MYSIIAFAQEELSTNNTLNVAAETPAAPKGGILEDISSSLTNTFTEMLTQAVNLIPRFIAMVAILIVGLVIAKILRWLVTNILKKIQFDSICDKTGLHEVTSSLGLAQTLSSVVAQMAFYGAMLMFLVAAVDVLGMASVSGAINTLVSYLPNVIGALVILLAGVMVGNFARKMAVGTAERMGFDYAPAIGSLTFGAFLFLVGMVAIKQLQIDIQLLNRIIEIGLMACGGALALSVGLGTRDIAKHVIAGVYARDSFEPGAAVRIGEHKGTIEAVRAINTTITTDDGKVVYIPNSTMTELEIVRSES